MLEDNVRIFEKSDTAGGLCRSQCVDGFTFDIGPHILGGIPHAVEWIHHSTEIEFMTGCTNNRSFWSGSFDVHPFQSDAVAEQYMAKMWKARPDELSFDGLNAQPGRKPGGVSTFTYPAHGGYQAITDAWAAQLEGKIEYHCDLAWEELWKARFDRVVWCAPIERPDLRYNSLVTVTCGFRGIGPEYTAIYLPKEDTHFHRLSFPTSFSPNNAPDGCFSVQGELSLAPETDYNPFGLVGAFRALLDNVGIRGSLLMDHSQVTRFAYPVPTGDFVPADGAIHHGRSGGFKYWNLDAVVAASMELAEMLNK